MSLNILTQPELEEKLARHKLWLQANGAKEKSSYQLMLSESHISKVSFSVTNFSCAQLVRCHVEASVFNSCDFSYSVLIGSTFHDCEFLKCNFVKADFRSADCSGNVLPDCNMSRADFTDANLRSADLSNGIFDWAWLVNTDLRFSILEGSQFKGTRLANCKVYNTRKFHLGSLEGAVVKDIDVSPEGTGKTIVSGLSALDFLRKQ